MSERIRVGVVGTSWWSDHFHLAKLKEHPRADLVAVCGRDRTHTDEMAAKHAIPQVYTDYQDMITLANLQAIVVATPDDLHYPITMAALDAGLHVLCEKPLAYSLTQAKAMLEKAQSVGVKHMVCFTYRWNHVHRYLKQLLDEGYIGRCYHINIRFLGDFGRNFGWRNDKNRTSGSLSEMGSHMIDLARWYVGDIDQVFGQLNTLINRTGPDGKPIETATDAAILALRFANGAQGAIQLSWVAQVGKLGNRQDVILCGEEGTLEVKYSTLGGGELRGIRRGEKDFHTLEIPQALWGANDPNAPFDIYKITTADSTFIDSILSDRLIEPTFYAGYKVQQIIDAAIQSDKQGRWVTVD
jgi:predicted dehydrogenase